MMNTTLKELPTVFKENSSMGIATWIVKYQNFNSGAAVKNAPERYSLSTLKNYLLYGSQYLKSGKRIKLYNWLYPYLDKCVQSHVQPLTPGVAARKRTSTKDYTTKENIPPVAKLEILKKPLLAKFLYGLRFDDTIKIFKSEEEASLFNKGVEFAKGEAGKIVTVELGEV